MEQKFAPLRMAMIDKPFSVQNKELRRVFATYEENELSLSDILHCFDATQTSAILSWSNGDAYRKSQELYFSGDDLTHKILTGSRKLNIRKELALILSDYSEDIIDKSVFYKLADKAQVEIDVARKVWGGICGSLKNNELYVNLQSLRRTLISERNVDVELVSSIDANIVVSTIHKSKGREFDNVVLMTDGKTANANDVKVYYVALTRSKNDVIIKKQRNRHYDEKTRRGRYLDISRYGKLLRIELGIDGDIDPIGFVSNELNGTNADARQKYIRDNVHIGDKIEVNKFNGKYVIVHNGHIIGNLKY